MDKEKFRSFEDLYGIKDTSPKKPANFKEKVRRFADDLIDDAQYYNQKSWIKPSKECFRSTNSREN